MVGKSLQVLRPGCRNYMALTSGHFCQSKAAPQRPLRAETQVSPGQHTWRTSYWRGSAVIQGQSLGGHPAAALASPRWSSVQERWMDNGREGGKERMGERVGETEREGETQTKPQARCMGGAIVLPPGSLSSSQFLTLTPSGNRHLARPPLAVQCSLLSLGGYQGHKTG